MLRGSKAFSGDNRNAVCGVIRIMSLPVSGTPRFHKATFRTGVRAVRPQDYLLSWTHAPNICIHIAKSGLWGPMYSDSDADTQCENALNYFSFIINIEDMLYISQFP